MPITDLLNQVGGFSRWHVSSASARARRPALRRRWLLMCWVGSRNRCEPEWCGYAGGMLGRLGGGECKQRGPRHSAACTRAAGHSLSGGRPSWPLTARSTHQNRGANLSKVKIRGDTKRAVCGAKILSVETFSARLNPKPGQGKIGLGRYTAQLRVEGHRRVATGNRRD